MQTFLPFDDFQQSALVLDNKRLGKQRVEVLQILRALVDNQGWIHHPATHMWRGYTNALVQYGLDICDEWINRGFNDTCRAQIAAYHVAANGLQLPPWFGLADFHAAHRSNLVRKDPSHYSKVFEEDGSLPYCWPKEINGRWVMRFKHAGAPSYVEDKAYKLPRSVQ